MAFVTFTRPDNSPVTVNSNEVLRLAPVPSDPNSPLGGPLTTGTRIVFKNNTHQDVIELVADVSAKLNNA